MPRKNAATAGAAKRLLYPERMSLHRFIFNSPSLQSFLRNTSGDIDFSGSIYFSSLNFQDGFFSGLFGSAKWATGALRMAFIADLKDRTFIIIFTYVYRIGFK